VPTQKPKEGQAVAHLILDRKLWRAVKRRALDEDVPAVEIVRRALADYLKAKGGKR
jgi:hypothetical protein